MAKLVYELLAKAGTYEKNGETKNRYHKCGVVFQTDKGFSAKIESLPVGFDGWLSLMEPREKAQPSSQQRSSLDDGSEGVPF